MKNGFSLIGTLGMMVASAVVGLWGTACSAQQTGAWRPSPTLAEDLGRTTVRLAAGYVGEHPRLLFSAGDRRMLKKRAADYPKLWKQVLASSRRLGAEAPPADVIASGEY